MALLSTKDRVQKPVSLTRGLGAILASWIVALLFALFTHVVTCAPCYDDDLCGSARIDANIQQIIDVHTLDVGNSTDGGYRNVLVPSAFELTALCNSTVLSEAVDVRLRSSVRENIYRNSSLAHRQTVVLVI